MTTNSRLTWTERVDAASTFYALHGLLPRKDVPAERSLFLFIERQRTLLNGGELDDAREAILDARIPAWRDSHRGDAWTEHVLDTAAYFHAHGHYPAEDSPHRAEELLGRWLAKQIDTHRAGKLSDSRREYLNAALPGWLLRVAENAWLQRATEVAAYVDRYRRIPYKRATDDYERVLGEWLHNQRQRLTDSKPAHRARMETLHALVPGWKNTQAAA